MIRDEQIRQLADKFKTRDQEVEQAAANCVRFVNSLYDAVEEVIGALHRERITTVQLPERARLTDGREQISFVERDYRFVFVPYEGIAFPALGECGLPDELVDGLGQKRAGRLVILYHPLENPDAARILCSFYVFANGFWCVCGAGSSEYRSLDEQEITDYVVHLLELIQDGFRKYWHAQLDGPLTAGGSTKPETRFYVPRAASEE